MLRITADVNGFPIGHIYTHNKGAKLFDVSLYDAAIWNTEDQTGVFGIEDVIHFHPNGWTSLVHSILDRLEAQK